MVNWYIERTSYHVTQFLVVFLFFIRSIRYPFQLILESNYIDAIAKQAEWKVCHD